MSKRPRNLDLNQLAKRIVDEATGDEPITRPTTEKNQSAVELGKLGGKKGGKARADSLTPQQRSKIAKKAIQTRWETKQVADEKQEQQFPPVEKKHIGA